LKVDVVVSSIGASDLLQDSLALSPYKDVLCRGFRIHIDKTGCAWESSIILSEQKDTSILSEKALENEFSISILTAARALKFAQRGDLWRGQSEVHLLRKHLLTLIEWHAITHKQGDIDTWYDGRNLHVWAKKSVTRWLPDCFSD
jgi:aminoglycoside 6-adenylyltransferase